MGTNTFELHQVVTNTEGVIDNVYHNQGIGGVIGILLIVGIIGFIKRFGGRIAEALPMKFFNIGSNDLETLKNHLLFSDIENNINVNIHNIEFGCELRREVFTDVLTFRLKAMREEILKILERPDYFDLGPESFKSVWDQYQQSVVLNWHTRCRKNGIFEFVIEKMDLVYKDKQPIIDTMLNDICMDQSKHSVFEKTDTIFDVLKAVHYSLIINTYEDALKLINGDFIGKKYKTAECPGTENCKYDMCHTL